jgi:hypothetical protein
MFDENRHPMMTHGLGILSVGSSGMTTPMIEQVYTPDLATASRCPLFLVPVSAGFPSPADDYLVKLNKSTKSAIDHTNYCNDRD